MAEKSDQVRQGMRNRMKALRAAMSPEQVNAYSAAICGRLLELAPLRQAERIMAFASIDNEVDLSSYISQQQERGKSLFLPRTGKDGNLEVVKFTGWQDTKAGVFGIREPVGAQVDPGLIEAVIVPGLVFDGHGYRLGYGKGYYDRFLRILTPQVFACGVCYEFQVVADVCPHGSDMPVHWIVTEKSELAINWDFF